MNEILLDLYKKAYELQLLEAKSKGPNSAEQAYWKGKADAYWEILEMMGGTA